MATYLPGVTDYIPQIQPFVPDYNFYAGALQMKQSKYDAARKQLSTIYGSLLNAPMTRDDNLENRESFFKTIEQDIHKMSGMDLSLAQNYEAAADIFTQLLDNKHIVKDMVWTKQFENEYKRSEGFRNCVDPDKCGGGWWEGGQQLLMYNRDEFKRADKNTALKMGNARYTPSQDITKMALQLAKDADLNVSIDQDTGQWITTTKNGPLIMAPLQNLFMGSIGNNPKVMEYYQAQEEYTRKSFMYENEGVYGSLEAAEQAYINELTPVIESIFAKYEDNVNDNVETQGKKVKYIEDQIQNATPDKRTRLEKLRDEQLGIQNLYNETLEDAKQVNGTMAVAAANGQYTGTQLDRIMASYNLGVEIGNVAQIMAHRNYEFKIKENPYSMEAVRHKNRMMLEEFKHANALELAYYKGELSAYIDGLDAIGGPEANVATPILEIPGATALSKADKLAYEHLERGHTEYKKTREGLQLDLSYNEKYVIDEVLTATFENAELGNVQAQEDYISMVEHMLNAYGTNQKRTTFEQEETFGTGMGSIRRYGSAYLAHRYDEEMKRAASLNEQYEIAKKYNKGLEPMTGTGADQLYNDIVAKITNPEDITNASLRDYLLPIWESTTDNRRAIQAKSIALTQMDEWFADKISDVVAGARSQPYYGERWADAFQSYFDDKGYIVSKSTFVNNMVELGYDPADAASLYRADERLYFNEYIDDDGSVGSGFWTGTRRVFGSIFDAIGTTIAGVTIWPKQIYEHGDGNPNKSGFEYDSPTDVANWGAPGSGTRADAGRGNPGVHDMWKRAFHEFVRPDGDQTWFGITGAGEWAARGVNYSYVDPAKYRSISTMATISYLEDAMTVPGAIVDLGYFSEKLPEHNTAAASILHTLYTDMKTNTKGKDRPILNVTYSDIAGGNSNVVALNIKMNEAYRKRYQGSEKNPGLYADATLISDGFTIYMPRDKTQNLFTMGTLDSPIEKVMKWTGEIKFDTYPDYVNNFALKLDPMTGGYVVTGSYRAGLDENGKDLWYAYPRTHESRNQDLNELVAKYDLFLAQIVADNKAIEETWVRNNKSKI